ncbi:MAG: DUF3598 family protein, partial [Coleofasciculaceae cyanobacterium SM2_3_26]|nr:DUF3598 family protein [Coleofasciculaceae cyanobacterium SM2_3_26]
MGKSQWSCLLENLGVWQGSFTRFSPDGGLQTDTPTEVSLEGIHDNQTVRQTIRRFLPAALAAAEPQVQETAAPPQVQETAAEPQVQETILEYSSLGRGVLFFETGA